MKKIITIVIILLTICNVHAQMELSVAQCREMALKNSYDMQIASTRHDKTVADQKAVFANFLPKISGSATYAYIFEDIEMGMDINMDFETEFLGIPISMPIDFPFAMVLSMKGMYMAGVTLQQPVFAGGKIVTGNKMAKKGVEITEENKQLTEMNVILEAEKSYWMYVSVQEKVKLLESYVAMLDSLYLQVSDFSRLQMAMPSDVQKVKSQQSNIKYQLQRAKNGQELSRMALCYIIGMDWNTPIIATDTVIALPSKNPTLGADISLRPELRIMQKQVEISKLMIQNTRADFLPMIGFGAGYTYVGGMKLSGTDMNMSLPMIMGTITIPIFHFGEGAKKIKSAKFAHKISELELEKNSKLMNIEAQQALLDFQNSFLLIESAEEAIIDAEAVIKIASDNYEMKMGTTFDILEARTQWQEAHSNLIEARAQCKIKEMEYLKATGTLRIEN